MTMQIIPPKVFLDAAFAIVLANEQDNLHTQATVLADDLEVAQTRLITTRAVLLEIGNALAKLRYRYASIQLLTALEADPFVEVVSLTDELYARAYQLYSERPDKEWGLTDCVSFIVMQDQNRTAALTSDRHFQQAGFHTLLHAEMS